MDSSGSPLKTLPLDGLHRSLGAKFAPFSGYDMPVQYEGLITEHNWTRTNAGLFDVSHMGPCFLRGWADEQDGIENWEVPSNWESSSPQRFQHELVAKCVEHLTPAEIEHLKPGRIRYTVLLNQFGGVIDDMMVGRPRQPQKQGSLYIVANAGQKEKVFEQLPHPGGPGMRLERADDRVLLALQGPKAHDAVAPLIPDAVTLPFMAFDEFTTATFGEVLVSRSGYTGEDGFEILVHARYAEEFACALLSHPHVKPAGLGARDTLRLEAGLCLYGHELNTSISPVEADLAWIIGKRRRDKDEYNFPGAVRVVTELEEGPKIKRVGIRPADRAPARDNTEIQLNGHKIGVVTSGGFSPTLNAPISMGYVETPYAAPGTKIDLIVRGQPRAAEIVALPFVPHRYFKG